MYISPRQPYEHQTRALHALSGRREFALLMAMRTGKTKVCLDDFGRLEDEAKVTQMLVVAPAGVYETWRKALDDDLSPDLLRRCFIHIWHSGAGSRERTMLKAFRECRDRIRILIVNVEALSSVKEARGLVVEFLRAGPTYMVIDESTIIKNPKAKRTRFLVQIGWEAAYRRILSGLPAPRSPLDIYSQFEFLNSRILRFNSFFTFRAYFAIMRKQIIRYRDKMGATRERAIPIIVGYQNLEELQRRIAPHSFRLRLEDTYQMPKDRYVFRDISLTNEQHRIYQELLTFANAQLKAESYVTATLVITQMLRLHQVLCGHTTDDFGKLHDISENRTAALIELLEEYDGKAIIWVSYDRSVEKVSAALRSEFGDDSVARFWGGNRESREEEERRFKEEASCRFMVATPAAGGRGRTWSAANLVVYYSSTNDLEHRSQSEERPHAVGKTDPVTFVDLRARGTVDEKIIRALREKINLAGIITGDNYQEWLV